MGTVCKALFGRTQGGSLSSTSGPEDSKRDYTLWKKKYPADNRQ